MRCWFSLCLVMVVVLSGCGGAVDTGPAPVGGYNTTKVKYEENPLAHVPKTDVEVGEFVVTKDADPIRLEKVITARNTEVFTFRGQIRGQPLIARPHHIVVECNRDSEYGSMSTAAGAGVFQLQGDLAVYGVTVRGPRKPGRHRLTIKIYRVARDDGTIWLVDEPETTVIAEGEIEVQADDQKLVPTPDPQSSKP